jgi:hypothetical protein
VRPFCEQYGAARWIDHHTDGGVYGQPDWLRLGGLHKLDQYLRCDVGERGEPIVFCFGKRRQHDQHSGDYHRQLAVGRRTSGAAGRYLVCAGGEQYGARRGFDGDSERGLHGQSGYLYVGGVRELHQHVLGHFGDRRQPKLHGDGDKRRRDKRAGVDKRLLAERTAARHAHECRLPAEGAGPARKPTVRQQCRLFFDEADGERTDDRLRNVAHAN